MLNATAQDRRGALRCGTAAQPVMRLAVILMLFLVGTACTSGGNSVFSPSSTGPNSIGTMPAGPASPGSFDDRAARSQVVLDAVPVDGPGCSAAAAAQGQVVWAAARGLADVQTRTPLTTATRFDIGSVSKQFTATAVLLLSLDGALALTDPLSSHVSGLPGWADRVSVDQLVHHTSGIPDYDLLLTLDGVAISTPTTQQDALNVLTKVTDLKFEPGSTHEYSNSNYLLLAEVVHAVSGQPLPEFLTSRVFRPLNLDMAVQAGDRAADVAIGYQQLNGQLAPIDPQWAQVGDGSVITTPTELTRWGDNYRTGQVGGPPLFMAVTAGSVATSTDPEAPRYGAGIYLLPDGTISHPGGWGGHLSVLSISPDRRTTVAISCNRDDDHGLWQNLLTGLHQIWITG